MEVELTVEKRRTFGRQLCFLLGPATIRPAAAAAAAAATAAAVSPAAAVNAAAAQLPLVLDPVPCTLYPAQLQLVLDGAKLEAGGDETLLAMGARLAIGPTSPGPFLGLEFTSRGPSSSPALGPHAHQPWAPWDPHAHQPWAPCDPHAH